MDLMLGVLEEFADLTHHTIHSLVSGKSDLFLLASTIYNMTEGIATAHHTKHNKCNSSKMLYLLSLTFGSTSRSQAYFNFASLFFVFLFLQGKK